MEIKAEKLETLNTTQEPSDEPSDLWHWLIFAGSVLVAVGTLGKNIS